MVLQMAAWVEGRVGMAHGRGGLVCMEQGPVVPGKGKEQAADGQAAAAATMRPGPAAARRLHGVKTERQAGEAAQDTAGKVARDMAGAAAAMGGHTA